MIQPWKEVKRRLEFKKYSRAIEGRNYELPSGEITDNYITVGKPGACVQAITTDDKIITARQYRPGPNVILRELPGGVVDDGEDPKIAAMRELNRVYRRSTMAGAMVQRRYD